MAIVKEKAAQTEKVSPRRPQSGDFQWSDVYVVCLEYWRWILLSLVFFVGCAAIYLYFAHPQYLVSGKMLVIDKNKKNSAMSAGMAMLSQIPFGLGSSLGGSLGVDNEKEILQSKVLLRDVVNDLGLHTEYRLSKWGRSKLLYQQQPVNAVLDQVHLQKLDADIPATYRQLELTIKKDSEGYHVKGVVIVNDDDEFEQTEQSFTKLPAEFKTDIGVVTLTENIVTSPELKEKFAKDYTLKVSICPPMMRARQYAGLLSVDNDLKVASSIIELQLKDENILRGIDFLNRMVEVYNRRANEEKDEEARKNDEFVTARLAKIDAELGSSDANWENFKKINKVTDPQLDATETLTKKSEYESKLVEVGTQQQLLDYLSEYVNNPSNQNELIPSSIGITDEATMELISKYNEQVQERKRLLIGNSEASPRVQQLSSSIKDLNNSVRTALSQARQSSKIARQNIEREYNKYMSRVNSAPQQERVLTEIGRERGIKQSVYLMMLQKREENAMDLANTADKGKLIDETAFERKVQPRGGMLLIVALLMGFVFPVVLLLIYKKSKNRIETPDALNQLTGNAVSGWLPVECPQTKDAFRRLRTSLLNRIEDNKKVILVISPCGNEGTTYVATHLADSLASTGKHVTYCSMDLRHTSKASTSIAESCSFDELIPTELKKDKQLTDLFIYDVLYRVISGLRYRYDFVVIDCPAIIRYPDAIEIARLVDTTCCVCRSEQTQKSEVEEVCKLSEEYHLPHMNFVLNAIDMTKKKYRYGYHLLSTLVLTSLLCACGSSKNVAYFQNADTTNLDSSQILYEARIMPKDILTITVSTINPEAASTFNMTVPTVMTETLNARATSQPALQSYLVGNDGKIQFPVVGSLHVGGMTTKEVEQMIHQKITPYMAESENPIVTVRLSSYSVSVLGEVQSPGSYQVSREKVSVLEALAMAGDLTIYGVRSNVKLIREDATGRKSIHTLNLNDANLMNSPYYYLQQNDILYVQPNKAKAQNSDIGSMTTLWFSATSILISIASLLVNILR